MILLRFSVEELQISATIDSTSQAGCLCKQLLMLVRRNKIIWKKHRCEVQNVRRRSFSVISPPLVDCFSFQHLKWQTKQMTVRMNLRYETVIGGCFLFLTARSAATPHVVTRAHLTQDESRWITRISFNDPVTHVTFEEVTYKGVNQLNSRFEISQENALCQPPPATSVTRNVWLTTPMSFVCVRIMKFWILPVGVALSYQANDDWPDRF